MMKMSFRVGLLFLAAGLALQFFGCKTAQTKKVEAAYGPSESIVEVVSILRRHIPDDTYRFPPATDFTGRNVYRSTLLRIESIERIHADSMRSAYLDPVIQFSKARSLERLRAYRPAAILYRQAGERESALKDEALYSGYVCRQIDEALSVGIHLENPLADGTRATPESSGQPAETILAGLDERVALLSFLKEEVAGTHYEAILSEEIERADEARAKWFVNQRYNLQDGHLRALGELQRVMTRHSPSKRRLRHILALADLYDDLAHEYVASVPPQSMDFDAAQFQDLVDPATHLYEVVASEDGTTEKLEAARRLEAFLAFTLTVDHDRFTH